MVDEDIGGPPGGREGKFTRRLRELKERGCALLVVGEVPSAVHERLCRRMLGEGADEPRRRLLVFTNGSVALDSRLPEDARTVPGDPTVITASTPRSATGQEVADRGIPVQHLGRASVAELGTAIAGAIEEFEARHGTLAPAEFRLCLDSLSPLLDAHDESTVFEFLVVATAYVRSVDGMGHFHLPVERDAYVTRLLAPLFDGVVELRVDGDEPQQRWHLRDEDVTSRWLSL